MRKIIHIDMDCFYAAIEVRDNPNLAHQPVAVGGTPEQRGVLCTCNYRARKYGVHAAMPTATAFRLCPSLVLLPVNMSKYKRESQFIHQIFHEFTDQIEPLSLDEAYLDVTDCSRFQNSATYMAQAIRASIAKRTALTASAGVSVNKYLAKIASDWHKPNGQKVIGPEQVAEFLIDLPLKKLPGVGKVTNQKLQAMGYQTCGQLQVMTLSELCETFGAYGKRLYELCRGIDESPVVTERFRKSLSVEETFIEDLMSLEQCLSHLPELMDKLQKRLSKGESDNVIAKQFVKVKFHDFTQTTVECLSDTADASVYHSLIIQAHSRMEKPVRLLGLGVRFKLSGNTCQLTLFE